MAATSSADLLLELEPSIWRSIAGTSIKIPAVNSYVYYFPQGHLEHSPSSPAAISTIVNSPLNLNRPFFQCTVQTVRFLINATCGQPLVNLLLHPIPPNSNTTTLNSSDYFIGDENQDEEEEEEEQEKDVVSFVKVLTNTDSHNVFSIPKHCADSIFPRFDLSSPRPRLVQTLKFKDVTVRGNNMWQFKHLYRGAPRRHVFTTGWTRFVNDKGLVSGDSVVFIRKKSTREMFIAVRRGSTTTNVNGFGDGSQVVEAIGKAVRGEAFEVVYYPRVGMYDFVVNGVKVDKALGDSWIPGKRVRMGLDITEDTSRVKWYEGTIRDAVKPSNGPWRGSPWRMLQVSWDEALPSSIRGINNRVSPWQVEHVIPNTRPLFDDDHTNKRMRLQRNNPEQLPNNPQHDDERGLGLPTTQLTLSVVAAGSSSNDDLDTTLMLNNNNNNNHSSFASHDEFPCSGIQQGIRTGDIELPSKEDTGTDIESVSTVLSIGGPHCVQGTGHRSSFQLFGKNIEMS